MIIMSLILVLFQGARIGAVKMKTEVVADIAMNSVLAEYSRELYQQYGLLMVDTSYGTSNPSIINTEEHLGYYVKKNLDRKLGGKLFGSSSVFSMYLKDLHITGSSFAMDNNAAVLKRNILSYMAAEPLEGLLSDVTSNVDMIEGSGLNTTDVEAMARKNQEVIDSIELPTIINEDGEEEELSLGNPADAVHSLKGIGALNLAVKDKSSISKQRVDLGLYSSGRNLNKGTGLDDIEDISFTEKFLLDQYYYEKCSRYLDEMDKSLLKYQLEYLAFGFDSDWDNLDKMASELLFIREAANMLYLFGCESKVAEAELVAGALTAVLFVPELKDPVKYSILFAWTFAESISDLNILFSGGRVPLFKSDSTWRLSLMGMLNFRDHLSGGDLGEGLYYKDYLRARLFMTSSDLKIRRMADIIEMDIRRTEGNGNFMIDHCLDVFRAEIHIGTYWGYDAKIERIYGYEY
ncbi:hypothetical protein D6855_16495 [Butyrivibrio sp. CB08]|nr:hypothetical protein D6855_16495 [Butyrivibrio sp. CB08]